ncbi:MAG: 2-aminoethylphosphonate-pyruvate transaminase [Gammaproteobacteria bacterium]|jgi:2-aminoethylphosphonate-pyruvate transaminase
MKKYLLFTPGPVNVASNVRTAIAKEDICHREADFEYLLQSIEQKLLQLFEIKNTADYRAVVITGSGTAANESMLSSVVGEQNILIIANGEFGDRLYNTSKIHNKNTFLLDFGWGNKINTSEVETYLNENKIDVIAMVHHETSSGMLNSLYDIGTLSKVNGSILIVDGVSSAGAETIDMEQNHIAFFSSSSSKAIGSYSGLSFVIGRKEEFERLKSYPAKSTYLNLYKFYHFINTVSQTPNTPATHLFFALEQALINILDEGISNRYASIQYKASLLRRGMLKCGLTFLIKEKEMCSMLTTVNIPAHIDVTQFRNRLREKSIIIYECKGCFRGKVFQVGNIGELSHDDIQFFIDSLKDVLASFIPIIPVVVPITNALRIVAHNHKESLDDSVLSVVAGEI